MFHRHRNFTNVRIIHNLPRNKVGGCPNIFASNAPFTLDQNTSTFVFNVKWYNWHLRDKTRHPGGHKNCKHTRHLTTTFPVSQTQQWLHLICIQSVGGNAIYDSYAEMFPSQTKVQTDRSTSPWIGWDVMDPFLTVSPAACSSLSPNRKANLSAALAM